MIILSESSYFYGWPDLLDNTRVAKIAGSTVSLAETARDYLRFGDFCTYFADKLDPGRRTKKMKKIMENK